MLDLLLFWPLGCDDPLFKKKFSEPRLIPAVESGVSDVGERLLSISVLILRPYRLGRETKLGKRRLVSCVYYTYGRIPVRLDEAFEVTCRSLVRNMNAMGVEPGLELFSRP